MIDEAKILADCDLADSPTYPAGTLDMRLSKHCRDLLAERKRLIAEVKNYFRLVGKLGEALERRVAGKTEYGASIVLLARPEVQAAMKKRREKK